MVKRTGAAWVLAFVCGWASLQAQEAAKGPEYDVVSVRPTKDTSGNMMINTKADGYSATGTTVKFMIMDAYHLKNMDLVSGLPKWAGETRFDVETKMPPEMIEAFKTMPEQEKEAKQRLMIQAMLADRFKLKEHEEEKEMPAYALVQAKGGVKLKPLSSDDPEKVGGTLPGGGRGGMLMYARGRITGQMITFDTLAANMGMNLHRQVIDRTELPGKYDFVLTYTPDDTPADAGVPAGPSLFTALEEQMGLKLESIKAKIASVVVDHIEMPGANQ